MIETSIYNTLKALKVLMEHYNIFNFTMFTPGTADRYFTFSAEFDVQFLNILSLS